jgi:hypothetical protein
VHHDPLAADLVQIELNCCGRLGRLRVWCLYRTEDFALGAQRDDAPTAFQHGQYATAACAPK